MKDETNIINRAVECLESEASATVMLSSDWAFKAALINVSQQRLRFVLLFLMILSMV